MADNPLERLEKSIRDSRTDLAIEVEAPATFAEDPLAQLEARLAAARRHDLVPLEEGGATEAAPWAVWTQAARLERALVEAGEVARWPMAQSPLEALSAAVAAECKVLGGVSTGFWREGVVRRQEALATRSGKAPVAVGASVGQGGDEALVGRAIMELAGAGPLEAHLRQQAVVALARAMQDPTAENLAAVMALLLGVGRGG